MKRITKFLYCLTGLIFIAYALLSVYLLFGGLLPLWVTPEMLYWAVIVGSAITLLGGLFFFTKGLFSRRRMRALAHAADGGSVVVGEKALKNITFVAVEHFSGVLEDRVRVRVLKGKPPSYRVKIWLGIHEYSTLPTRHEEIRAHVADALFHCTGVRASRIDIVFYTAYTTRAHDEEGEMSHEHAQ